MKKALIILPVLALAACDKPTSTVELSCGQAYHNLDTMVSAKTYDDKAVIKINGGEEITLARVKSDSASSVFWEKYRYDGVIPGTDEPVIFKFVLDKTNGTAIAYSMAIGKNPGWSCDVRSVFHGKYEKPSKEKICSRSIYSMIWVESDKDAKPDSPKKLVIKGTYIGDIVSGNVDDFIIPQEDVSAIFKNWDYDHMYNNAKACYKPDEIKEEKDACEVLDRLNAYIAEKRNALKDASKK